MTWLDYALLIAFGVSFFSGFRLGLIYKLGSLVGLLIGLWIAGKVTVQFVYNVQWSPTILATIFFVTLGIVRMVCGWGTLLVQHVFRIFTFLPGLGFLNRILGALLSVFLSIVTASAVLYVASLFAPFGAVRNFLDASLIAPALINAAIIVRPLLPQALFDLAQQTLIDFGSGK